MFYKFFSKFQSYFSIVLVILAISSPGLFAQVLTNGSSASITNAGTIMFNAVNGQLNNQAATAFSGAITNTSGTIVFAAAVAASGTYTAAFIGSSGGIVPGSSNTERATGWVVYSAASGSTSILGDGAETYYTNLAVNGNSTKSFLGTLTHISSQYAASGGDRDYAGNSSTINFDGTSAQVLTPEYNGSGAPNNYFSLLFSGAGAKTLQSGQTAGATNAIILDNTNTAGIIVNGILYAESNATLNQNASSSITVSGANSQINLGGGASNFNGPVTINTTGDIVTAGSGTATIAGNLTINSGTFNVNSGPAIIANGATVQVNGGGTYELTGGNTSVYTGGTLALANASNATLYAGGSNTLSIDGSITDADANRDNLWFTNSSMVMYNNSTSVLSTVVNNPYGNLALTGANIKTITTGTNQDAYVAGDLGMGSSTFDAYNSGADQTLYLAPGSAANYAGYEEVYGKMQRTSALGGSFNNSTEYIMNNAYTSVQFTNLSQTPSFFGFSVRPGVTPANYVAATDIPRKITVSYDQTSSSFTATFKAGYLMSELGSLDNGSTRFYESSNSSSTIEKVGTGMAYSRDSTSATMHSVSLGGINGTPTTTELDGTADALFASSEDLLIRTGPTIFNTIANGRWSNPATWDEGMQPSTNDQAVIKHTVHVGFTRALGDNFTGDELDLTRPGVTITGGYLVSAITINNTANASLIFGLDGTTAGPWVMKPNSTITNNNTGTNPGLTIDATSLTTVAGNNSLYNGLMIFGNNTSQTSLTTQILKNNGTMGNSGNVQIGD